MKTNLISVSGKINSGKDTFTEIFQRQAFLKSTLLWENRKFGYKVKEFASMLTGIPTEDFEKREIKAMNLPSWWDISYFDSEQAKKDGGEGDEFIPMTGRDLLIRIGDGSRIQIHPKVWINALFSERQEKEVKGLPENSLLNNSIINPNHSNWIISDCRYLNEIERVKQEGGVTIKITSPRQQYIDHPSETSLDNYKDFDYIVDNSGSITDLVKIVDTIGRDLKVWI